jgi:hypothetical protein
MDTHDVNFTTYALHSLESKFDCLMQSLNDSCHSLPGPYPGFFWGVPSSADGAEGGGVRGGGVPLPAEKFLYFKYENDAFWCIFGGAGVKICLPIPLIKKRPRFHALITIG